jgi:short-subunit dehydrogenase
MQADPLVHSRPVALITGASRGIGAETARQLAPLGYSFVLAARSVAPMEELARELEKSGNPCLIVPTDVQSKAELRNLAARTLEHYGRVDVVLHNAGIVYPGRLLPTLSDEEIDAIISTNLMAPIELTRALLPSMLERGTGYIGFVDSVGGHVALPSATLYSTTKFGMRGFAAALRREIAHSGVNVCIISPGYIKTELSSPVWEIMEGYPLIMGTVDCVARAIVKSIRKPKRECVMPAYNKIFIWFDYHLPGLADQVAGFYMRRVFAKYQEKKKPRQVEAASGTNP